MAIRSCAKHLISAVLILIIAACTTVSSLDAVKSQQSEDVLARQARAMQRTVLEAIAYASTGGGFVGLSVGGKQGAGIGILAGIPIGFAAGSYVAYLQKKYATKEAQLNRLNKDLRDTNAEAEAVLQTMRVVSQKRRAELAAAKASADAKRINKVRSLSAKSLDDMKSAINGAQKRKNEFGATRSLKLVSGQVTGADREIQLLSNRISEMRKVAQQLSEVI